jgi:hypothetical protein
VISWMKRLPPGSFYLPSRGQNAFRSCAETPNADPRLKDPLIYYFAMLGKRFGMRQARIWLTFALVKPPDLTGGVCASPCNLIVRDRLTY